MNRIFNIVIYIFIISNIQAQNDNCEYTIDTHLLKNKIVICTTSPKFAESNDRAIATITDSKYISEYINSIVQSIPKNKITDLQKYGMRAIVEFDPMGNITNVLITLHKDCFELLSADEWCSFYKKFMRTNIDITKVKILDTFRTNGHYDYIRITFTIPRKK